MKVRGSLHITKDVKLDNPSNTLPTDAFFIKSDTEGFLRFSDLVIDPVVNKVYSIKGSLVLYNDSIYYSTENDAPGTSPLDLNKWKRLPTYDDFLSISGDMLKSVYDTNNNGVVDNAEKVNNHTVDSDVPVNAVFTDTVYDDTDIRNQIDQNSLNLSNHISNNLKHLTPEQNQALDAANNPSLSNPVATIADIAAAGGGDMMQAMYDVNSNGVVDDAERLGGKMPNYYASFTDLNNHVIDDNRHLTILQNDALDGANNPSGSNPFATIADIDIYGSGDMKKSDYDTNDNGIVDDAEKVNGHTVDSDVPSDAVFTDTLPELERNVTASINVGGIKAGDVLPMGMTFTEFVEMIVSPVIMPTYTPNSLSVSGVSTTTREVGSTYIATLIPTYNRGAIQSKDGHPDVPLTGPVTSTIFSGNGIDATGDINAQVVSGYQRWTATVYYSEGTEPYYDSRGNVATNLDSYRVAGSLTKNSSAVVGKLYIWYMTGALDSSPSDSDSIRALSNKLFQKTGTFNISIPAGDKDVAFYMPDDMTFVKAEYVESSGADVTGTFTQTAINVDDAGGNSHGYNKYLAVIPGASGYPENATYKITINL